jgi:hypothetical protein
MESFLKPRHFLRPRARNLCSIDAPVTGYKRAKGTFQSTQMYHCQAIDFRKHFVKGCERFCLFLVETPKPVLKHSVRGFDVTGDP